VDLIGNQGVEESYEEILRGIKGLNIFKKTNTIEIGSYKDGKYDTIAVQGEDINLTLDAELKVWRTIND
jgi:penicillin-binding protein 2